MNHRFSKPVLLSFLALILFLGGYFRFVGLDWDEGRHLHPDERFLTMVEVNLRWPESLGEYFNEAKSGLNPRNVGHAFFVYGTLPTTLVKGVAIAFGKTDFEQVYLVGRILSGLCDLGSIFFLFLLARELYQDDRIALLASFLLATAVLAIQLSHFFAVDSFAGFFFTGALYCLARVQRRNALKDYVFCGLLFGMAVACKLSVITFAVLPLLVGIYCILRARLGPGRAPQTGEAIKRALKGIVLGAFVAFWTFRVCQPDAFQGPDLLGIAPSERWLENVREVRWLVSGEVDYPPSHQWASRARLWHPWSNMVLWGMGLPLGLAAWAGWIVAGGRLIRNREWVHLIPTAWIALVFLHQGMQFIMPMRYFLSIYPALALLAAWLLIWLWRQAPSLVSTRHGRPVFHWTPARAKVLIALVAVGTLLWAWAFTTIYRRPHSRIEASRWIYANIPSGSVLASEHWDDVLPVPIDGKVPYPHIFRKVQLPWYDEDGPEKLAQVVGLLDEADAVILSSNRLYGSIPRLPMRYPMTVRYYQSLFNGTLGFEKAAEFTSYPSLFGLEFPDRGAEEPFTVYDHPQVQIYRKTATFSRERAREILGEGVDWEGIVRLLPKQVSRAPTALMLPRERRPAYRRSGTWSALFNRRSFANWAPVLSWALLVEILGLLAAPFLFLICRDLPDGGYSFAKAVGLLVVGWTSWMLASLHVLPFSKGCVLSALMIWGLGAFLLARFKAGKIRERLRSCRRVILFEEAIFWGLFLMGALIRWRNPDLWHPLRGSDAPMAFAYLNAVVKSVAFPPYDPWFAGGLLNYPYFGFVPWAMVIKLSGIVPSVAYNLTLVTLLALTGLGAFGVTLGILHRKGRPLTARLLRFALVGFVFVALVGNFGVARRILGGIAEVGEATMEGTAPVFNSAAKIVIGTVTLLRTETPLPVSLEEWYLNPAGGDLDQSRSMTEFPYALFLIGDLSPRAMALPFVFPALGLLLVFLTGDSNARWVRYALLAFLLGALWAVDGWSLRALAAVCLVVLVWSERQGRERRRLVTPLGIWLGILAAGYLLFLPFHRAYVSPASGFGLRTSLGGVFGECVILYGFFLFVLVVSLFARFRIKRDSDLETGHNRMPLLFAGIAFVLILAAELVSVEGDSGGADALRSLHLQAWVLLALASAARLPSIVECLSQWSRAWRRTWTFAFMILLVAVALYPLMATWAKIHDRLSPSAPRTLDAGAYLDKAASYTRGQVIHLAADKEAIEWLQDHARGSPVIAEANAVPGGEGWEGRYSVFTGLPTILGWEESERRQRALLPGEVIDHRLLDIQRLYDTPNPLEAEEILQRYNVEYIIVGPLERALYTEQGIAKFESAEGFLGTRVFDNGDVQIYGRVEAGAGERPRRWN